MQQKRFSLGVAAISILMTYACANNVQVMQPPAPADLCRAERPSIDPELAVTSPKTRKKQSSGRLAATEPKPPFLLEVFSFSERLDIPLDGTENPKLLAEIDRWLGTPYQWGGCSEIGIDCSCLIRNIYEAVYDVQINRTSLTIYQNDLTPVAPEALREGDIVCFETDRSPVSHVGLYLKDHKFVHASQSRGVMVSDLREPYFRKRFVSGGRVLMAAREEEDETAAAVETAEEVQLVLKDLVVLNL